MDAVTRREFLTRTLVAGAGATLLSTLTDSEARSSDDNDDVDPGFIAGQVLKISPNGQVIAVDREDRIHLMQLRSSTRIWKRGLWDQVRLQVGDCVYARGTLAPSGILAVDTVWVSIASLSGAVARVSPDRVDLEFVDSARRTVVISDFTVISVAPGHVEQGTAHSLAVGDSVYLVGFADASGEFVATRVFKNVPDITPSTEETVVETTISEIGNLAQCTDTWKGLASFFCCGTAASGCGYSCPCSSRDPCPPWCQNYNCQSDRLHMAWQKVDEGSRSCRAPCDCNCPSSLAILACGTTVTVTNPCRNMSTSASIRDCGPTQRCVSPQGCHGRTTVKFDLTPCTFTAIGGNLADGFVECNVSYTHPC